MVQVRNGRSPAQTRTIELLEAAGGDAKLALELAIQESAQTARDAEVKFGERGIESASLASMYRLAQFYAGSDLVPDHFRAKPQNCFIAVQLAMRMKVDVFMLMQNMYIVHGKPGIEAKLAIALANSSGKLRGPIRWKECTGTIKDKTRTWTSFAIDKETGDTITQTLTWAEVEAEGWPGKSGSKWKTIPELMGKYRSAMWLIRTYFPEVIMGLQSTDEIRETAGRVDEVSSQVDVDAVDAMLNASEPETAVQTTTAAPEVAQDATGEPEATVAAEPAQSLFDAAPFFVRVAKAKSVNEVQAVVAEAKDSQMEEGDFNGLSQNAAERIEEIRAGRGGKEKQQSFPQ